MFQCPKCLKSFDDGSKICRECGAILEEIADGEATGDVRGIEPPEVEPEDRVPEQPMEGQFVEQSDDSAVDAKPPVVRQAEVPGEEELPWRCGQCLELVPANFDLCWHCGVDRQGGTGAELFGRADDLPDAEVVTRSASAVAPSGFPLKHCVKCDEDCVMSSLPLAHVSDGPESDLKIAVYASSQATGIKGQSFRGAFLASVVADVCGECGHVELRVTDPQRLYDHYRGAQ